jgi:YD repeat-containing protein
MPIKYEIRFYRPNELGSLSNGYYNPCYSSVPFVKWTIENPDASPTVYNRLRVTEERDGNIKINDYEWNQSENTWSLSKGNGLQVKTKKEEIINGNRVVTETIKDSLDHIASKTTWHTYPWGAEIIEEVIDPDNAALTTTMTYYDVTGENGYGSIKSQSNPDGSWTRYEYDSAGRKLTEISTWLDSPVGTAAGSARVISYDYTPQDSSDSNMAEDIRRPRRVTETIEGIVVSKTYYVYIVDSITGERTEIVERAKNPSSGYGDTGNERQITVTYEYGNATPESGKTKSITYPDGKKDSYTYEKGGYTPGANSTPGTFTAGIGEYVRETITHGTTANPEGIANKTTRDIVIINPVGLELLKETYVYTGTGYERIKWSVQSYDDDRHVTEINNSNGTKSTSIWNCCGKESDTDIQGIIRSYTYDDLNRVETETKEAGNDDIYTAYTNDAAGRVLTQTISSGSLELNTTNVYDIAGRIDYATDQAGLLTDYTYTSEGRITTVTRPGGATEITTNYIDGRVKSITGIGVVSRYYTYGVNADGTKWTKVNFGSADSLMWEKTTVDTLGRTVSTEKPGPNGTETIQNIYNNLGQLERIITPGQADTIYTYDSLGNQILSGLDINGNSQLDPVSNDRINRGKGLQAWVRITL